MRPYYEKNLEHCIKPHRHSFYQILWFRPASDHFVDFEIQKLGANTLVFLDKYQIHYFCPYSKNEGILIHFNDYFLLNQARDAPKYLRYFLFNGLGKTYNPVSKDMEPKLEQLIQLMQGELGESRFQQKEMLYHLFSSFLVLAERIKRKNYQEKSVEESADYEVLFAFKQATEEKLAESVSVAELSEQLNVSNKKLSLITQTYLHQTPAQFIASRKALEAKRLLSNTQLSIKEIAYGLGFDQATYFTKFFKKQTELTPKEFRAALP
ncbi:hypothetical protein BKI52_23315 [marine bacterium AO1-C]|nr:hypothetical protein BKI52_23315 [marine bacterium AO1-C]